MGIILYHYVDVRVPLLDQLETAAVQERMADRKKDKAFHRGQKGAFEMALQMVDIAQRCEPGGLGVGMRPLEEIVAELRPIEAASISMDIHRETKPKKEKKNARSKKK